MEIRELKQKRAALVKQARELLDKAELEKRELTTEETQQYESIMSDVDKLGVQIEREERMKALESEIEQVEPRIAGGKEQPMEARAQKLHHTSEYREAFWQAMRQGQNSLEAHQVRMLLAPEVRQLVTGVDAAGGYLVPDEFERQLVQQLQEQNVMRTLATVIQTGSGERLIPVENSCGTATWLGEADPYTESDATFSRVTLSAYKLGTIIKVSEELLNDSAFNLDAYVASAFARRFGDAEEAAFVNGDGSNKPTGVVQGSDLGVSGAAINAVTADELIDLYHSLRRPYRQRASWLMADGTVKAIRKLKDNDGQYLWQPGLATGRPDTILGRPVVVSDYVPAMGSGAVSILFGDFSYYWVADRQGRVMQRLVELYAANGFVGFRMFQRVDGKLILPEAVKHFKNATA